VVDPRVDPVEVDPLPGRDDPMTCPTGSFPIGVSIGRDGLTIVSLCIPITPGTPGPVADPLPADPVRQPLPADPTVPPDPVVQTPAPVATTRAEHIPEPAAPPPAVTVVTPRDPDPVPPDPVEEPAAPARVSIGRIPPDAPPG
jgi:hypothetical protein